VTKGVIGEPVTEPDSALLRRVRAREEQAFVALVERHGTALERLSAYFVRSPGVAEQVLRETWGDMLRHAADLEDRPSLRADLLRLLADRADRCDPDERLGPLDDLTLQLARSVAPAVDGGAFLPPGHRWGGHWAVYPPGWRYLPQLQTEGALAAARAAVDGLVPAARLLLGVRDIEAWTPQEVTAALGVAQIDQLTFLHAARSRVRDALAAHLGEPS